MAYHSLCAWAPARISCYFPFSLHTSLNLFLLTFLSSNVPDLSAPGLCTCYFFCPKSSLALSLHGSPSCQPGLCSTSWERPSFTILALNWLPTPCLVLSRHSINLFQKLFPYLFLVGFLLWNGGSTPSFCSSPYSRCLVHCLHIVSAQ